jgi:hypothetical protein
LRWVKVLSVLSMAEGDLFNMLNEIARSAYPDRFRGFPAEAGPFVAGVVHTFRQSMVVPEARTTLPQRSVSVRW